MKNLMVLLMALLMSGAAESVCAQTVTKEHMKMAKKEAKRLSKEGWKVAVGSLPLETQLAEYFALKRQQDEDGNDKYVIERGEVTAGYYSVAKKQALFNAKRTIAGNLRSEMEGWAQEADGNQQETTKDATSAGEFTDRAAEHFSGQIRNVKVVAEYYKDLPNNNVQVTVFVACELKKIEEQFKEEVRKGLLERAESLGK